MPLRGEGAKLRQQRRVLAQLRRTVLEAREAPDAGGRLERRARQVVAAAAGVRVEVQEPLVLLLQRRQQPEQRHVLVHIREVAGVEAVAVLHCLPSSALMECITWGRRRRSARVLVRQPRWPEALQPCTPPPPTHRWCCACTG